MNNIMGSTYNFTPTELKNKLTFFKREILKRDSLYTSEDDLLNLFLNPPKTKKLKKKKAVHLIPWRFHNISYFIDESNNDVYSFQSEEKIGKRVYDPDRELTYIDFN